MFVFIFPVIILTISLIFLYVGIKGMGDLLITVISFWGRVMWKSPDKIEWDFNFAGPGLVAFVLGMAGMLWSVIVLAIKFAALA
jgi:hypothetical protein